MVKFQTVFFSMVHSLLRFNKSSQGWRIKQSLLVLISAALCIVLTPVLASPPPANSAPPGQSISSAKTKSLIQHSRKLYEAGQFTKAMQILQRAALASQASQDDLSQAIILSNLSLSYQHLGQWQEAEQTISKSISLLEGSPKVDPSNRSEDRLDILAQALDVQGRLYFAQGQSQSALNSWQQVSDIYGQLNDQTGQIRSHIHQSEALLDLGMSRQALKRLKQITPELATLSDPRLHAEWLHRLGNTYRALGDLKASQDALQQSWAIAKASNASQQISEVQLALGETARAQKDISAALNYYQQAATSQSPTTQIQAKIQQFNLLLKTEQQSQAQALLPQIRSQIATLPPNKTSLYARIVLAQSLINTKLVSDQDLAQILATSISQAKDLKDIRAESSALGTLGKLYENAEQDAEAFKLTQQATSLAQQISAPDLAYRWQWQLGRLLKHQGDRNRAISAYTEATNSLQALRKDLVAINTDASFSFREAVEPVYRELVDLLLQTAAGDASKQDLLQKARYTIESLQLAELDNYFQEACLDPLQEVDTIEDTAAIVYPIILENRLEVVLSLPNQKPAYQSQTEEQSKRILRHYATSVSPSDIEQTVERLQEKLVLPYTSEKKEIQPLSQEIYRWLIQPAERALITNGIKTIVFVPDGPLRSIPMAVLHDGNQYLVEKYNIVLTPGLRLFQTASQERKQLKSLIAGVTKKVSIPQKNLEFAALPNIRKEVEEIQSRVPSQVLLNQKFTTANLDRKVKQSSVPVVHIATHGQFSSKAEDTFILAWGKLINVNEIDDLLRTRDLSSPDALELLVLSACETAEGDKRAALGIAGVAVRAGARSTLASLWLVDDESTPQLMSDFYDALIAGASKAEALSLAQRQLLQGSRYHHPRFWASFILLGNWL